MSKIKIPPPLVGGAGGGVERRVVLLTPSGRGAVATLLVEGPGATAALAQHFLSASGRALANQPIGKILFGRWISSEQRGKARLEPYWCEYEEGEGPDISESNPAILDPRLWNSCTGEELVLVRRDAERWEIHCHGGAMASAAIAEELAKAGFVAESWQEWLRNSEIDPIRASARIALASARTTRVAAILLDQHEGALRRELDEIELLSSSDPAQAAVRIDRLLLRSPLGLKLVTGWKVVLAGEPNVGKSSLMNALIGYQRSIVFDQPGTTRDVLTAAAAFAGWPVTLCDTAGLREGIDELESAGIERARRELAEADLVLHVVDGRDSDSVPTLLSNVPAEKVVTVWNKWDLVAGRKLPASPQNFAVSAVTGLGLEELAQAIGGALVPEPPPRGAGVPFTPEQVQSLQAMKEKNRGFRG